MLLIINAQFDHATKISNIKQKKKCIFPARKVMPPYDS